MDDQEYKGPGPSLPYLYHANVKGFAGEVLSPESKYYLLGGMLYEVNAYLQYFDVRPNGPDILKHALGFGLALHSYLEEAGERHIIRALVLMRTIRVMNALAALNRADGTAPPMVMVRKIMKVWRNDHHVKMLGSYGTYMMFKTWSLG